MGHPSHGQVPDADQQSRHGQVDRWADQWGDERRDAQGAAQRPDVAEPERERQRGDRSEHDRDHPPGKHLARQLFGDRQAIVAGSDTRVVDNLIHGFLALLAGRGSRSRWGVGPPRRDRLRQLHGSGTWHSQAPVMRRRRAPCAVG